MRVVVTGDSHVAAIKLGADRLVESGGLPSGLQLDVLPIGRAERMREHSFVLRDDHIEFVDERVRRRLVRLPIPDPVDWYGVCGMLNSRRLWAEPELLNSHVSAAVMTSVARTEQRIVMEMLLALRKFGCKVFVVEAPRPFRHDIRLRANPGRVIVIDRLHRSAIRTWLKEENIPIVDVPEGTFDEEGFMLERFRGPQGDPNHCNAEFGALVVEAIVRRFLTE